MKQAKIFEELLAKDNKALYKELEELNKKLADLRFKSAFRNLKNFREMPQARKTIAQIWTILNSRVEETNK